MSNKYCRKWLITGFHMISFVKENHGCAGVRAGTITYVRLHHCCALAILLSKVAKMVIPTCVKFPGFSLYALKRF